MNVDTGRVTAADFEQPHVPVSDGGNVPLFLAAPGLVTFSGASRRELVDELLMFEQTPLAERLCKLNQWDRHTLNSHQLEQGLKYRQLDADYFALADKHSFYLDLENRWISCLKGPKAAGGSLFLFDVDADNPSATQVRDEIANHNQGIITPALEHEYCTRNGKHLITAPFNPNTISAAARECLHRDALMLWSY